MFGKACIMFLLKPFLSLVLLATTISRGVKRQVAHLTVNGLDDFLVPEP